MAKLKAPSPRARLYEQIEKEYNVALREYRRADRADIIRRVVEWAKDHPDLLEIERIVHQAVLQYEESRRPRVDSAQLSLFEGTALVPVAEGIEVQMQDLTADEFDAWFGIETEEHLASVQVYALKGAYYRSRRPMFAKTDGDKLGHVEEQHFGWVRPPDPPPDDAQNDDDD